MATRKKATTRTSTKKAATKKAASSTKAASSKKAGRALKTTAKKTAAKATAKKATDKKSAAKKATNKKTTAKKTTAKKTAAKKTAAKKATNKKSAAKKTAAKKTTAKKTSARKSSARKSAARTAPDADVSLFYPLSEGERADALRILNEDSRLSTMASVGRYRVIAVEPLAVKPPHELSGRRLARIVIYDYASDTSVDGCVDLDAATVVHLRQSRAQPMLAREEEAAAISVAMADDRVKSQLSLGDEPLVAMHYWSLSDTSLSFSRRSAAVVFGRTDRRPSLIAIVDLIDNLVCEIVPASQW